ncbi:MAG: DegT/DnrJ/EryC1/StrS family aminotransferase [Vampirovibrionales bacterium]
MVAFPINDALYNETRSALGTGLRCHVPGHGGQPWFGTISDRLAWLDTLTPFDTTELPGLDTLSDPAGIILESQTLVAQTYGAAHSFYLVNGASAGLHASLLALSWLKPNQPVLVARNAHRAVIAGLLLARLEPIWVLPSYDEDWHLWDGLTVDALEAAFRQHPHASAIVLPHPTYEGRPADIQRIASWAKAHSLVVIVDEAHGTLWPLIDGCPSALQAGADVVIHSAHKSAGSLTQTAVLHLGPGSALPKQAVGQALNLLHTSSPSYPLLASLEAALLYWASATGRQQLNHHMQRIHELEQWIDHTLTTLERHQHTGPLQCLLRVKPQPGQRIVEGQTLAEAMEECYGLRYEAVSGMGVLLLLHGAFTGRLLRPTENRPG